MPTTPLKIRCRERYLASPPRGERPTWIEFQVVQGRRIIARYTFVTQATRDYPKAVLDASSAESLAAYQKLPRLRSRR